MRGIPVLERAHGTQLRDGAVKVLLPAVETIGHRERVDAVERLAADGQQTATFHDARHGLRVQQPVGQLTHVFRAHLDVFVGRGPRLERLELPRGREQAWMRLPGGLRDGGRDFRAHRLWHQVGVPFLLAPQRKRQNQQHKESFLHAASIAKSGWARWSAGFWILAQQE